MLMIPPNFLRQEDKAVEFLSGLFQMLGPIGVLVGGFAAASLSVSLSQAFQVRPRQASNVGKVDCRSSSWAFA